MVPHPQYEEQVSLHEAPSVNQLRKRKFHSHPAFSKKWPTNIFSRKYFFHFFQKFIFSKRIPTLQEYSVKDDGKIELGPKKDVEFSVPNSSEGIFNLFFEKFVFRSSKTKRRK